MSLDNETREKLIHAANELESLIGKLDGSKVDFRALDLLEIALSLFLQQMEDGTEYIDVGDNDVEFQFLNNSEFNSQPTKPIEPFSLPEAKTSLESANFKYLDNTPDPEVPSSDELADWYHLDLPE